MVRQELIEECKKIVDGKVEGIRKAIKDAQEAANNEMKSSVGDKYETGRAMMHLEKEKLSGQLAELLKTKKTLDQIDVNKKGDAIGLGNVVFTSQGTFLIAVSLGKTHFGGKDYFVVSAVSPVGQQLMGKRQGDKIELNGRQIDIKSVN